MDRSSPTAPSGPPAAGTMVVYSAVGASDVIGFGSSKVCLPFEDCDGNGYVWTVARSLRAKGFGVEIGQLGIPAGVISRAFQELGARNGRTIGGNFIEQEMPFVLRNATLVTVFAGANEVNVIAAALANGAGGSNPNGYIDQLVAAFASDYATLISGIRARTPSARIVVLNLPNLPALPYLARASTTQKQYAQRASVGMTVTAINTLSDVAVVDLMCDARFYDPSIYSSDGFHPNDRGYAIMGAEVVSALQSPAYPRPKSACAQMTLF